MVRSRQYSVGLAVLMLAAALGPGDRAARGQIPSDVGQVWKTYDLTAFVSVAGADSEKHVVDWILQETGYPAWHGKHPASLSASDGKLSCYHTPEMQARVADVVSRFVEEADKPHRFTVRVLGFTSPAWRTAARPALQAVATATPGVQAWILPREAAAPVVARAKARADCVELPTGAVLAANGIPATLTGGRTQEYVADYDLTPNTWPGWQAKKATCDEGFAIDVHPLVAADGTAVDAVFRCRVDQIERMAPLSLPSPAGGPPVAAEVPQMAAVRIGERFRWPATHALVIGLGVVPWPVPAQNGAVPALLPKVERRDVVVVIEPRLGSSR
jgi:hypothetical protein